MASGLGPLVSVVLFALLGNRWEVRTCSTHSSSPQLQFVWLFISSVAKTCVAACVQVHTCRYVLLAGLVMMVIPLIVMCFFNDDAKLNHQQATEQARWVAAALHHAAVCFRDLR